jgi:hypothetical protein
MLTWADICELRSTDRAYDQAAISLVFASASVVASLAGTSVTTIVQLAAPECMHCVSSITISSLN